MAVCNMHLCMVCCFMLQVAGRTNDSAGDGTTTASVLAREMIHFGLQVRWKQQQQCSRRSAKALQQQQCEAVE